MNDHDYELLRESSWRRELTPAEEIALQEYLALHPETREQWESDEALNAALQHLPDAPRVSTNFTTLVLQTVRAETARRERQRTQNWFGRFGFSSWLPRAAATALIVGMAVVSYHQHTVIQRAVLARNVAELTQVVSSDTRLIEDIEPISRLDDSQPSADTELLVLMKK